MIISHNNAISVHKHLSCIVLIEYIDFHIIGEETLFSPTIKIIKPPFDPPSLRFPNDEPL